MNNTTENQLSRVLTTKVKAYITGNQNGLSDEKIETLNNTKVELRWQLVIIDCISQFNITYAIVSPFIKLQHNFESLTLILDQFEEMDRDNFILSQYKDGYYAEPEGIEIDLKDKTYRIVWVD